jgi:hypothetical protein
MPGGKVEVTNSVLLVVLAGVAFQLRLCPTLNPDAMIAILPADILPRDATG